MTTRERRYRDELVVDAYAADRRIAAAEAAAKGEHWEGFLFAAAVIAAVALLAGVF